MISYEQKYIDLLKPTYNLSQLAGIILIPEITLSVVSGQE